MASDAAGRRQVGGEVEIAERSGMEWDPETMRALAYRVVDLVVDRWAGLGQGPAWQGADRSETEPLLREPPPDAPRPAEDVIRRAVTDVLPLAGRIDHPRFFAFVPSSPTWPTVLADLLASGYNVFQGTWLESAGPSQVELVVTDWFRDWLGMPPSAGGLLTSGGSAANLLATVAARESAGNPAGATVYLSDQGHSSVVRAARIAGIDPDGIRRVPTGPDFALDTDALRQAIRHDRGAGRTPLLVVANGGATNTGVVDPLADIGAIARDEGAWFHVDAAYGGFAVLDPSVAGSFRGIEEADSVTLDPHKWLFQTYETGCLLVRDVTGLEAVFRVMPEYLQDTALGFEHVNFGDRGLQLSREFRALRVWMSIQMLGLDAFRAAIAHSNDLARRAEAYVREAADLELLSPASLGVVCYRYRPRGPVDAEALDALNEAVQDRVVETGRAMISSTRLRGAYALRLCIMNYRSTWDDVRETLGMVQAAGRGLTA